MRKCVVFCYLFFILNILQISFYSSYYHSKVISFTRGHNIHTLLRTWSSPQENITSKRRNKKYLTTLKISNVNRTNINLKQNMGCIQVHLADIIRVLVLTVLHHVINGAHLSMKSSLCSLKNM